MSGENAQIQKMANLISEKLFNWFKWEKIVLMDENFDCVKVDKHTNEKKSHTHPVDVVFKYFDPYLNKNIYLNTDLKSYSKTSITSTNLRTALKSLAQTIDCAKASSEWQGRYIHDDMSFEIRAMLFVYNHDGEYHKKFYEVVNPPRESKATPIRTESLPVEKGQQIHIVEPLLIRYMSTIISDMNNLHHIGEFPHSLYEFFYPNLHLHKTHGEQSTNPATIEAIASPYLIIYHGKVTKWNEVSNKVEETYGEGYLIYYNRSGSDHREFVYLFDTLSKYQILNDKNKIRIRVAHHSPHKDINSNFKKAITTYASDWGYDEFKTKHLNAIDFQLVEITKECFSSVDIGWRK
jgi:hypothetical protein